MELDLFHKKVSKIFFLILDSFSFFLENAGGISVITGTKKRYRLHRQQHIITKSDPDGEEDTCDIDIPTTVKRPLGRQYSDPTPRPSSSPHVAPFTESKSNLLTIPNSHLIKQNSDSALPSPAENTDTVKSTTDELIQRSITQVILKILC